MIVNIHAAKTNLSRLIARAEAGEEIIIARAGSPRVRLSPIAATGTIPRKGSWLGSLRGKITFSPGWDEPDRDLLQAMEGGQVFPPDQRDR